MNLSARFFALFLFVVGFVLMLGVGYKASTDSNLAARRGAAMFSPPVPAGGLLFVSLESTLPQGGAFSRTTLIIEDVITPVLAGRILALPDETLARVELNTIGGDVQSAIAIANRLRAAKAHTHVSAGAKCFSACALVYQGGVTRSADREALFLLHYAVQISEDPERAHIGSIWGTVALIEAMIDLGLDAGIYDQMPGFGDWLLTAPQARALGLVQYIGSQEEAEAVHDTASVRARPGSGQS